MDPDEFAIAIELVHEFYLKDRDDPYQARFRLMVGPDQLAEAGVSGLMATAQHHLDEMLFTRGAVSITLSDERKNYYTVLVDEIQSVSILAPDPETIDRLLEEHHAS